MQKFYVLHLLVLSQPAVCDNGSENGHEVGSGTPAVVDWCRVVGIEVQLFSDVQI